MGESSRPAWMPGSVAFAWIHGNSSLTGCTGLPTVAVNAGFCDVTLDINGAANGWTTSNVDQSNTQASGFKLYYDDCQGQTAQPSNGTLNTTSMTVGQNTSGGYNALVATATCKGASSWVGTAYRWGYFEVTTSFTVSSIGSGGWEAPLWLYALDCESKSGGSNTPLAGLTAGSPTSPFTNSCGWSGQTAPYFHGAEYDVIEQFLGQFSVSLNELDQTSHEHYGATMNTSGIQNIHATSAFGQSNFSSSHTYWALWKSGSICYGYDTTQVGCDTWTAFVNNGGQAPPPTSQSWAYGVGDLQFMAVFMGCNNSAPCNVTRLRIIQANASNNITQ